ncbi:MULTISPECIES: isochorismatase family protein [unclassified Halomonas]|uniref:cysteine hydrolase family protein n=1 Tax=unclassified Halomonas TaxID=2609666 RepID=UPI00257B2689|nr:isochorismatase family protein [Halomonas sp.]MCJ8284287.1 isochorismatase family protein [Halomonas sp.]NQY69341.1 isochorismatase family protein [Halomonas sp.]
MTTALLVIDVQASFLARPYWDATRLGDWPEAQRSLIDLAREAGMLMVRIIHTEPGSQGAFDPDNGLTRAMEGFEDPADVTFYKTAHNAFTDTGLDRWLRGREVSRLWISGIRTEQCCETTTRVASDLGYAVDFVSEATLTFAMQRGARTFSASDIRETSPSGWG